MDPLFIQKTPDLTDEEVQILSTQIPSHVATLRQLDGHWIADITDHDRWHEAWRVLSITLYRERKNLFRGKECPKCKTTAPPIGVGCHRAKTYRVCCRYCDHNVFQNGKYGHVELMHTFYE